MMIRIIVSIVRLLFCYNTEPVTTYGSKDTFVAILHSVMKQIIRANKYLLYKFILVQLCLHFYTVIMSFLCRK
jgi:hypothetical protein